ncbi:hypothetical protein [Blastococcus mobilis]|uniref:Uncharacterized protein n=1 Tax=Blastococcus mobilis TaxID=1938746 RepID=A0A238XKF0_9ACTN|nr:hypothetical protein [Blastococcus mobilis]SNR59180.1 hypothetical protein SAMN06272737_11468 [Blastococcus mobilis]
MTAGTALDVPPLLRGLCDDAAIFPPGNLPLDRAVPAHREHRAAGHAGLVGAFVLDADRLPQLAGLVAGRPGGSLDVALTVADPASAAAALSVAEGIAAVRVVGLEVAVPAGLAVGEVVPVLDAAVDGRRGVTVFVELPRDERRPDLVRALAGTGLLAKLRTGGVRAELYPGEEELARAVVATARAGLPFKATAGLHHALRNTDPRTGFEQHGFLNVLTAVDAALSGADVDDVEQLLAERDPDVVTGRIRAAAGRAPRVREQFRSFGTCSIAEPRDELVALGLLDSADPTNGDPR